MASRYLTLGRGELWFDRFSTGTLNGLGERYIGNSPAFSVTIDTEMLDHYDSDHGIAEIDESIVLQMNRSGALTTDVISPENQALFFFGDANALTVTGETVAAESLGAVIKGLTYQIGTSDLNPSGVRRLSALSLSSGGTPAVAASGTVTFAAVGDATDTVTLGATVYTLVASAPASANEVLIGVSAADTAANLANAINAGPGAGTVYGTGTVANASAGANVSGATLTVTALTAGTAGNTIALATTGDDIAVSGATLAGGTAGTGVSYVEGEDYEVDLDRARVLILENGDIDSGTVITVGYTTISHTRTQVISGGTPVAGALRYIEYNPIGSKSDWYMPYVKLSPNGDFEVKGDVWQEIPLSIQVLKKTAREAIYCDDRPWLFE